MDGGCRASSLGVLINKLSQSRRAPSNRLPLFHLHKFHLPSVPWARSQTLNILFPKINLWAQYAPQLIAARTFLRNFKPLVFCFCLHALLRTRIQQTSRDSVAFDVESAELLLSSSLPICSTTSGFCSFNLRNMV